MTANPANSVNQPLNGSALLQHFLMASYKKKYPKVTVPVGESKKLVIYLNSSRSANAGGLTLTDDGDYPNNKYYGKITSTGAVQLTYAAEADMAVVKVIKHVIQTPVETLALSGRKTGQCCFCAHQLTTAASLAVGYGPICADNFGLPWGEL